MRAGFKYNADIRQNTFYCKVFTNVQSCIERMHLHVAEFLAPMGDRLSDELKANEVRQAINHAVEFSKSSKNLIPR